MYRPHLWAIPPRDRLQCVVTLPHKLSFFRFEFGGLFDCTSYHTLPPRSMQYSLSRMRVDGIKFWHWPLKARFWLWRQFNILLPPNLRRKFFPENYESLFPGHSERKRPQYISFFTVGIRHIEIIGRKNRKKGGKQDLAHHFSNIFRARKAFLPLLEDKSPPSPSPSPSSADLSPRISHICRQEKKTFLGLSFSLPKKKNPEPGQRINLLHFFSCGRRKCLNRYNWEMLFTTLLRPLWIICHLVFNRLAFKFYFSFAVMSEN